MATRKHIWDAMDKLEGKKIGSSHAALEKEKVRQGYKASALKKKTKTEKPRSTKNVIIPHFYGREGGTPR